MTEIALATLLVTLLVLLLTLAVMAARAVVLPALPVSITVNGTMEVPGTTGEKLLSILGDARIPIPAACGGQGTCGQCRVRVPSGAGEPLPTEVARLGPKAVRQGVRLACQVVVRNPLSVEVPEEMLSARSWQCRVISNTMLAPLIKELVLDPPEGERFAFRAGAFVQITAPPYALDFADIEVAERHAPTWNALGWQALGVQSREAVSRAYSVASTPAETGRIVLNIRLAVPPPGAGAGVQPGIVSSYLFGLKPGETVSVAGPFGDFRARETDREMVFVGGGVGMAPLRAIIFDQLERVGTQRRMSFWYGARSTAEIFYREEFDRLAERHANFRWTIALSDLAPGEEWPGATGFVHDVLLEQYLKEHPAPEDCEFYLCGPPLMTQAVISMLGELGVESESIFNDDFGS